MLEGRRFPFIERSNTPGVLSTMPYLPLTLTYLVRREGSRHTVLSWRRDESTVKTSTHLNRADLAFEVRPRIK
jgi:hypothetical protein